MVTYRIKADTIVGSVPGPAVPFSLDKSQIITDLSSEKPQWILSAYGPGRQAPAQLFGGQMREQSFEEMRLLHCMASSSGNPQQAVCYASLIAGMLCY
jgi:nucleoporin NUP42